MITRIPTKDMSREEWLNARKGSIGGSDAAAVLGLTQYSSPYALWAEKTGKLTPEDISGKEAVRLGNDLEQYVADRFSEETGKKLRRDNYIIKNSDYPFAHANVDRLVIGEPDAGFEAKTTSSWNILQDCREGKYPDSWYCQITHYMMVTGAKKWYLGVLCLGQGFFWFEILRNEAEITALAAAEREFWLLVETSTPPAADGSEATADAVKAIFADSTEGYSVDLGAVGTSIEMYNALGQQIKDLDTLRAEKEAEIKMFMRDAEKGMYGATTISWKTQNRSTFDRKAFEAANGTIPPQFFKQSESRPFRVTVRK